ncbi:hypothetical protein KIMH_03180 [Bombiscardovia apis]|uniref:Uncharacterized protein n=1 Tax=Bombiscardovia apis TaxID=2932182 RepID=A0ABN6SDU9_9BIFI|nr:hypothetical protein [Bombiscardovia apis]BDR54207.1 hypothetical protein KIMH_03180 [Bombiscardovia apis]
MTAFENTDIANIRKKAAMQVCGIFDEEEVGRIEPISYIEHSGLHTFITVWMFGNKKIYSAMYEGTSDGTCSPLPEGRTFFDVYRFKNISDIRLDVYGCVISMKTGKKLELKTNNLEGKESFMMSAHGLVSLWDEYDD